MWMETNGLRILLLTIRIRQKTRIKQKTKKSLVRNGKGSERAKKEEEKMEAKNSTIEIETILEIEVKKVEEVAWLVDVSKNKETGKTRTKKERKGGRALNACPGSNRSIRENV